MGLGVHMDLFLVMDIPDLIHLFTFILLLAVEEEVPVVIV